MKRRNAKELRNRLNGETVKRISKCKHQWNDSTLTVGVKNFKLEQKTQKNKLM